ncbi:MAG: NAD(P)/FAD-dependent oxidoreductase [Armatimonadota bacterium]|nr:NAD(P)/FAD-dependent oxidoreductase [Armatimonadota bacterium]
MDRICDITIIGGGPSGLFAAYYAGFRGLTVRIVDSQPDLGGQVTALYPDKYIYDVPGFPRVLGKDLVANLVEQAMQYQPEVFLNEELRSFERLGDGTCRLVGTSGIHHTRVVIITAGIGAFTPKTYGRPELDRYAGRGLFYAVRRKDDFQGKRLLVVGGGDSALDWALDLLPVARHVTLIHRRDTFRAHVNSVRKLQASPVTVKVFCELKALRGDGTVREAVVVHTKTGEEEILPVDAVLAFLGVTSNLGAIATWGLALQGDSIVVNTRMETNLPGIYAAGDVVEYPGKLKLIVTGFGEAATAVNNAARYINPDVSLFPGHSSALAERREQAPSPPGLGGGSD